MEQVDEEHNSHKGENIGSPHSSEHDDDEAQKIEDTEPNSLEESREKFEQGSPQGDMQGDSQGTHEEGQNSPQRDTFDEEQESPLASKDDKQSPSSEHPKEGSLEKEENSDNDDEGSRKVKDQIEYELATSPRQGAMLSSLKVTNPRTSRKKVAQIVTPNVTRALRSKDKLPKQSIVELPKKRRTKMATQSKGKEKEESSHEKERDFDIIHINSDDSDNEAKILESLFLNREEQIQDLRADLERSKNLIHFLQTQNKQMNFHMAVYETRTIKYQKDASKAQIKLEELMGEFNNNEEEDQPRRKRPRTMGLKRALEKQKEEEAALFQSFPLTTLFTQEIENSREAFLERVNKHLENKLEKANRDLNLQRKMTEHFKKVNQFARRKLKVT